MSLEEMNDSIKTGCRHTDSFENRNKYLHYLTADFSFKHGFEMKTKNNCYFRRLTLIFSFTFLQIRLKKESE